ncbi:TetR family transcriptional regulator [Sphingomonas oleivorans]|uniref:TetR family transcriptional regulator n=1 Tax=Sphingomonas oleivorans TaxID=1735121 RepID=A0A2T5FWL1_9SPHN|nr:TetR/AcrR family transcriptional regulator [Sphingomonas oleivorans]PTQ10170.1 TetR family transcriptional regulator [Sphingomonas oleivorans]
MNDRDPKRRQLIEAALATVSRYGFRKTSMQDIADAAGVSRAALYLHFSNKEDVFRSVTAALHADALDRARAAFSGNASFAIRLRDGLCAFMLGMMAPIHSSPHGQELFDANLALAADINAEGKRQLLALLVELVEQAEASGEIILDRVKTKPPALADMIFVSVSGMKYAGDGLDALERRISLLADILGAALGSDPGN